MKQHFKKQLKKYIYWLIALFLILFLFRLGYGYTKTYNQTPSQGLFFDNISNLNKNYASNNYEKKLSSVSQSPIQVDQKYEKIAEVSTKSTRFETEEKATRTTINKWNALVQFEQKSGNVGYRKLNLVIGVPPQNFDTLYNELITIGKVLGKQITKKDKTNEYKELNAKKQSLEKIRASLIELKSKGGRIAEYMDLENRVLEIEQQLQGLGVSLGDFDDENEFCTIRYSLLEGREVKIGIMQRVKVALEWTVKIYLRIMTTLFFISLFAYFILLAIDKLKFFKRIINRGE